ncbi:cytoplasmic protein [Aliihoeflea sp. 40Bstr573]|uniref:cytoplasmic protein n=1 Tax=Aliihoeflea sp. 40Bstr573 TaxID=2696467 RepID=UPI00209615B5|nr:cytoplasmic protein [Aliihoeflea sp. 40Bstr573]
MIELDLKSEALAFVAERDMLQRKAAQRVALLCNCGIEIEMLEMKDASARAFLVRRLRRLIERERIRGSNRHWSYDLNRHIALKQALDEIDGRKAPKTKPAPRRRRQRIVGFA